MMFSFEAAVAQLEVSNPAARRFRQMRAAEHARYSAVHYLRLWAAAADIWRGIDRAYELNYSPLVMGSSRVPSGQRAAGERAVAEALALATRIGAAPLRRQAEQFARQARLSVQPELSQESPEPDGSEDRLAQYGLTAREVDGAFSMLAYGLSSPQIGKALFISPKTASVHVSNILSKLDVSGRVEAATVVHRLGLAERAR